MEDNQKRDEVSTNETNESSEMEQSELTVNVETTNSSNESDVISNFELLVEENEIEPSKNNETTTLSYNNLTKAELLENLKQLAQADEDGTAWQDVRAIKAAFYDLVKEEQDRSLQTFLLDGGLREEFQAVKDENDAVFTELFKGFDYRRQELKKKKDAELAQNAVAKKAIVEDLKALAEEANLGNMNLKVVFDKLHELQEKWRTIGMVAASENRTLGDAYRFACDKVYEYTKINKELRELDFKKNLEIKTELCVKAEALILEPSIKLALDGIKSLQEQWKEAGMVSKEMNEEIWARFKKASDEVFGRLKEYIETVKSAHEGNKTAKQELIGKLEIIVQTLPDSGTAWQKMTEEVEALLGEWKKVGFAAKKDNDELWSSFKQLRDKFYNGKETFFESSRKAQQENYRIKNDLCMKAEELKESTEWRKATETIIELQKTWKATGAVNYKQSEKLWQRFRAACDHYFERKKANFAEQDAMQDENLKAKLALIQKVEEYQRADDHTINFENLKNFQTEWQSIGHVPMKEKEKVNKAFKTVIDKHFDGMRATNFERGKEQFKSKIEHLSNRSDGKSKVNEEMYQIQEKIRRKEHEVATLDNNIGFFGNSKGAESLLKETKKKMEGIHSEIKMLKEQLKMLRNIESVSQEKK